MFLLIMAVYVLILCLGHAYPFGNRNFLYGDAYDQYFSMFHYFLNWIKSNDHSLLLWNAGMGTDLYLDFLYYGLSPFNLIILLLGYKNLELAMVLTILVKVSCIGVTALYFFEHTNKRAKDVNKETFFFHMLSFVCSLAYALSGFVLAYGHNLFWLDGLILLPLVALGIERLESCGDGKMYMLALAAAFLTNFYFAFYICLFALVYFLLENRENFHVFVSHSFRFVALSLLSVMMSAVVLLPAVFGIMELGDSSESLRQIGLDKIGNIGKFLISFYPLQTLDGQGKDIFTHNNFCGTIVLIFSVLFFVSKKIDIKTKIKFALVVLVLVLGLNWIGLNYIMHGLTFTHGLGNRFAILLIFMLLLMTFMIACRLQSISLKELLISVGSILCCFILELIFNSEKGTPFSYILFMFLLVIYSFLMLFVWRKSIQWKTFCRLFLIIWILEILTNSFVTMPEKSLDTRTLDDIAYESWKAEYEELSLVEGQRETAQVKANYMYDSETNWYSSLANGNAINSFKSLGLSYYKNVEYSFRGTTGLTALMYNVRYVLTDEKGNLGGYHEIIANDSYSIYEADNLADFGFMASSDLKKWSGAGTAIENQNEFVSLALSDNFFSNEDSLFSEIEIGQNTDFIYIGIDILKEHLDADGYTCTYVGTSDFPPNVKITFQAEKEMDLYMESMDTNEQYLTVKVDGERRVETGYIETSSVVHIGHVKEGQTVCIIHYSNGNRGEEGEKNIRLYSMDEQMLDMIQTELCKDTLKFQSTEGESLNCHIDTKKSGVLYIALPYHNGYTIYVDGNEVEKLKLGPGLMGIDLESGSHEITITYKTPGLRLGVWLSAFGIVICILYFIFKKIKTIRE